MSKLTKPAATQLSLRMAVDWTDDKFRSLDELARIAFPLGSGVTADTLKRRARQGKLVVYRPGKAFVSTLVNIKAMLEATRVQPKPPPVVSDWRRPVTPPDPLGRSEAAVTQERVLYKLDALRRQENEKARLRKEERARKVSAEKLITKERRKDRAREVYREKKEARLKAELK